MENLATDLRKVMVVSTRSCHGRARGRKKNFKQKRKARGTLAKYEEPNALEIPEILDYILRKSICREHLQNCRLVNRQWNSVAAGVMMSQDSSVTIKILTARKILEFMDIKNMSSNSSLTSILLQSSSFQLDAKLPSTTQFTKFSVNHAFNIKRLVLSNLIVDLYATRDNYMRPLYWFIFHQLPQVEYIEIQVVDPNMAPDKTTNFSECWASNFNGKSSSQTQLTSLKVFNFFISSWLRLHFSGFIKGIVEEALNLEELNVPLEFTNNFGIIEKLLMTGRAHIIKEVEVDLQYRINIEMLERFCGTNPKIRVINSLNVYRYYTRHYLRQDWDRLEACLTNIYKSSVNSLETIKLDPMAVFRGFHLPPVVPNVSRISITVDNYNKSSIYAENLGMAGSVDTRLFYDGATFSQRMFPNLKVVEIRWEMFLGSNHSFASTFGNRNSDFAIPTVNCLVLKSVPSGSGGHWIQQLSLHFPKVKELKVLELHYSDDLKCFIREVCRFFSNLEVLFMKSVIEHRVVDVSYMDSCVTGISEENCRELLRVLNKAKNWAALLPSVDTNGLCQYPSLRDMKCLKSLTLKIARSVYYKHNDIKEQNKKSKVFSPLASVYAFDCRTPKIEVNVFVC